MEQKKTVLIVDDAGLDRDILTMFLKEKYRVLSAENGLVAENILESGEEVDLILLDIVMPVVNGFAFLRWMLENPQYRSIPVVLTSYEVTTENILKGLKMGVCDVIFKPYDWDEVVNRVDKLIALAEGRRLSKLSKTSVSSETVRKTVLIVDDVALNRDIMKETLRGSYEYLEAATGREALEMLRRWKDEIDLVLLDLWMPDMDGLEMIQRAMEEKLLEYIPVIAVTSEDSPARLLKLIESGVCEVVQRPFSPAVLHGRLDNLVELYRYRREAGQRNWR